MRRVLPAIVAAAGQLGCLTATPFGSAVADEDRDTIAKNLARLLEAGPVAPPFTFVALGDTHSELDDLADTVAILGSSRGDARFVVHTGDLTDNGLLVEFEWAKERLDRLPMPYLTSLGNHDALSRGDRIYGAMFGPYDYSFVYGGVKFVFFDSNTLEHEGEAPRREWLSAELGRLDGATRAIAVTHQPVNDPDDVEGGDTDVFYRDLARDHDVALFVHGHIADFAVVPFEDGLRASTSTFEGGHYTIVTVLDDGLAFERCAFDRCAIVSPPYGPVPHDTPIP
jgi:hypothetical protein